MALASSAELADWLRANQDKRGTPDYQTVLRGFQEAVAEESRAAAAPAKPEVQPQSGFMPALRAGATELGGGISALMGRTGLKDVAKAQAEYDAAQKRAKEIYKPTEEGWTEAPFTKFGELLGGSLPYMAAPVVAGGAALTLPVTGTAATVLGLGAAGLASATQFTATNLARQMEEGKKLEETDLGAAALAAVPQAALDTVSMRMIPGIGRMFGKAGIPVTKETAKEIAEQGLKRTLVDYTINTGKTAGIEGLTESAQQVFERLQAGLSLTDEKARQEYFDNFLGGAILGGTLSVPGRYMERSRAQREARGLLQEEAQKQQAEQRKAEEAKKQSPEYALKLDADYQAAVARMKELQAAVPKRPGKGALPEEQMAYKDAIEARETHLKEVLQPLAEEYVPRKAEIAQLKERQRVEGLSPEEYADYAYEQQVKATQAALQAQKTPTKEAPEVLSPDFADIAAPPLPSLSPEARYAQQRIQLAQSQAQGALEPADIAEYLMQDPAMAKRLVESKTPIPGLEKQQSNAVLGGLKLQLQAQEKEARAATRAELEQQQTDLAAQQRAVQTDAADLWKASVEETEKQATDELLRPNLELIRPTGPATVKTPENITPIQSADTLLRRVDDLFITRDQTIKDADTAFSSGNKEAGVKKAQEREAAQTALNQLEQTEGPGQALVTQRKAQETALMNAAQFIDDLRAGRTLGGREAGTASSTPQTLINQINAQRDAFITAAVQEAAIRRRLFGKALTQEEATKAGDQMRGVFNEWVTRTLAKPRSAIELIKSYERDPRLAQADWLSAAADAFVKERTKIALAEKMRGPRLESIERGAPEERAVTTELTPEEVRAVEQKALREFAAAVDKEQPRLPTYQIRGTKLITSDEGKARLVDPRPLEERRFGAYREATQVLQEQLQQIASRLREVPRAPQRVESLLKPQYAETEAKRVAEARGETAETRKGELVRRQEYVLDKIEKALMRLYGLEGRAPDDIRQTLERARAAIAEGAGREDITSEISTAAPTEQIEARKKQRAELQEKIEKEKNPFKRKALEKELASFQLTYDFTKAGEPAFTAGLLDSAEALADQINTGRQTLPVAKLDPRQAAQVDSLQKQRAAMQRAADKETDAAQKKRLEDAIARIDARINLLAKPTPDRRIAYAAQPQAMAPEARAPEFDVEGLSRLAQQVNAGVDAEMRRRGEEAGVGESQLDLFAPETAQAERRAVEARTAQRVRPLDEKIARVQQQLEKLAEVKSYKSPREAALAIKRMDAFKKLLDAYTAQKQEAVSAGLRERYTTEVDERALRKEQERLRADVGFMRTTAARFANAPAVKQAREAVEKARTAMKRGQTLLDNIKAAWAEADKRKEAIKQGKIQKLEREVASQREDYRVAFMSALSKARLEQVAAKFQPDIDAAINQLALFGKERAKALELKDKEVARDIKIIMDMEREALQDLRRQLAEALKKPVDALETTEIKGERALRGFTRPEEIQAAADDWVGFERMTLRKLEEKLARLKGPEQAPVIKEVKQQREAVARAETAINRGFTGLGLPGLRVERQAVRAEIAALEERIPTIKNAKKRRSAQNRLGSLYRTLGESVKTIEGEITTTYVERLRRELATVASDTTLSRKERDDKLKELNRKLGEAESAKGAVLQPTTERAGIEREEVAERVEERTASREALEAQALDLTAEIEELRAAQERTRTPGGYNSTQEQIDRRISELSVLQGQLETPDLTRKEKRLARKPKQTLYSSKGISSEKEMLGAIAQKIEDKKPLTPYEKRIWEERATPKTRVSAKGRETLAAASEALRRERAEPATVAGTFESSETLNVGGLDIRFSRGIAAEGLTKNEVVKELEKALGERGVLEARGVVTVVDSVNDLKALKGLPKDLQTALIKNKIPSDAKGFVYKERAYLIAENIGRDHALGVLLHEVGAHIGFRNFFNAAQYNALVSTVKRWGTLKGNSLEARVGRKAKERVEAANTPENQVDDELLAYAVEEAFNLGVEPAGVKSGTAVENWLRLLVNAFKSALVKFGIAPEKLKVGDLVNMAYGAANLELRGTWHGTGFPFIEFDFKYMGKGEGAQAYGWGTYRGEARGVGKHYQRQEAKKQLDAWLQSDQVKKWDEALDRSITFNGKTIEQLAAEEGPLFKLIAQAFIKEAKKNEFKYTPAFLAENLKYDLDEDIFPTDSPKTKKYYEDVLEAILDGRLRVRVPYYDTYKFDGKTNKNLIYYKNDDLYSDKKAGFAPREVEAAGRVGTLIAEDLSQNGEKLKTQADFDLLYDKAIKFAQKELEPLKNYSPEFAQELTVLKKLNKDDFVFFPPPAPPVPPPKGALARVLSTRPNEEYYLLDKPLAKQSAYIKEAVEKMIASGRTVSMQNKVRAVFEADMDADDRVDELESLLAANGPNAPPRTPKDISMLLRSFGIAGYRYLDYEWRDKPITKNSRFNYVDFYDKDEGPAIIAWNIDRVGPAEDILFSRNLPKASDVANKIIGKQPSVLEKIKNNGMGLGFRTQFIDGLAALEQIARTSMDALKGSQMMYYLRMYGMRMNFTSQAISNGALKLNEVTRKDGRKEWLIESEKGANIADIVKVLSRKEVKNAAGGADAANRLFTLYLAAIRGENVGFDRLNFGRAAAEAELKQIERELASTTLSPEDRAQLKRREEYLTQRKNSMPTEQEFRDAKAEIESDPVLKSAFNEARDIYNEYNKGLLRFAEQVGYLSKDEVARLLRNNDYIPYYRVRGGNAQLVIGGETPVRIGNLKDSPHLKELVGGEEPIFNFLDSSVQNTSMLVDAALRNIASKNVAYELHDIGLASLPRRASRSGAPTGALEFKKNGEDYYVTVETETLGVPSDLLVKGMAGIPTQLPSIVRMMGIPARVLRRAVTAAPPYIAKQVFRDSLAAFMSSGSDGAPLLSAVLQIGKESPLTKRGITGGQVFTGLPEDMSRLLREMQEGRPGWSKAFSKLEALSMEADALTRRSQYESYLKQGLSEMEATLMSLESMNFSKRGISPSMHWATTLIPFMNAQIQSLDVLYKAFRGHLPFNEQLDIRNKLMARGALMVAATLAYAAAMQDDDAYKNAKPDEKYNNWFVRLPFLDQYAGERVTLRVPIPFEIGYIFKALPEALFNTLVGGKKAQEDAAQAFLRIGQNLVPGGSSFGVPQAVKPLIEVGLGKSFFTGRDLESAKEQQQMPGTRYRDQTTELAKQIGEALNISPIKLEALISGYTGSMGMFLTQMLSLPLPQIEGGKAEKRLSETPLIGSMFQPSDATGIIDNAYKSFQEATQAQASYKAYIERGEFGKAQALMRGKLDELTLTGLAGNFKENMGKLTKAETAIKASNMSPEEKRKALDGIRQAKINLAAAVRAVVDRKEPQAALP